jgi:hypothetical protein
MSIPKRPTTIPDFYPTDDPTSPCERLIALCELFCRAAQWEIECSTREPNARDTMLFQIDNKELATLELRTIQDLINWDGSFSMLRCEEQSKGFAGLTFGGRTNFRVEPDPALPLEEQLQHLSIEPTPRFSPDAIVVMCARRWKHGAISWSRYETMLSNTFRSSEGILREAGFYWIEPPKFRGCSTGPALLRQVNSQQMDRQTVLAELDEWRLQKINEIDTAIRNWFRQEAAKPESNETKVRFGDSLEGQGTTQLIRKGPDGSNLILDEARLTVRFGDKEVRFSESRRNHFRIFERITRRPNTPVMLDAFVDEKYWDDPPEPGTFGQRFKLIRKSLRDGGLGKVAKCIRCFETAPQRASYELPV